MSNRTKTRFTNNQLTLVIDNWRKIALEHNTKIKTIKNTMSLKDGEHKEIAAKERDEDSYELFSFEISIPYRSASILIKTSETKFPHLFYSFPKPVAFEFYIGKEDVADKDSKFFGMQTVKTGLIEFDKKFVVKSNDEEKMMMFLDEKVRNFLSSIELSSFELDNSKLELCGLFNELDFNKMVEFVGLAKYMINRVK